MSGPSRSVSAALATAILLAVVPGGSAQSRGGVVRARIVNGTTGEMGTAERVALVNMASGMEPLVSRENVSGTAVLEGFEVAGGGRPYLLQITSGGVNYNQMVNFGRGYEVETEVTVYDTTREWKDVRIATARILFRREHEKIRVDKLFVVENRTEPKKTLFDPEGTFRFHLPPNLVELRSVSASFESGMPVSQPASPWGDGGGMYTTRTAFKPGTTDLAISYDVDYTPESYRFAEEASYPLPEVMALVAPADIRVEAPGWENMGPEPEGRYVVLQRSNVAPGTLLELSFSGGSDHAEDLVSSSSSASDGGGGSARSQITVLPDPTRPQKWIVAVLMGAALAWGLLVALHGPAKSGSTAAGGLRKSLDALESRYQSGDLSKKAYRKKKRELQEQLEIASRKRRA